MTECILHWFRNDLRLTDNPGLTFAKSAKKILPVFILDTVNSGEYHYGAASKFWLHHSLQALNNAIDNNLNYFMGDPLKLILQICQEHKIKTVSWNRCYEPWQMQRDTKIKQLLQQHGIAVSSHNSSLLWEPTEIRKNDGSPFKVFTPFYRKGCLQACPPRLPLAKVIAQYSKIDNALTLSELQLLPKIGWDKMLMPHWQIGEQGAMKKLDEFLSIGLSNYKDGRNFPAKPYTSKLSPYLRFGEISPNQIWYAVNSEPQDQNTDHFCSELGWREFSYNLLYHNHDLPTQNLQKKFDDFPWLTDNELLKAWQTGNTGIPMVDAGMRELWQTGYMHNRVRMIVASFLVKNLQIHWHYGERWFWDTLVDADLASNSASWQWVAGCGADAAPYFRIFNPVTQGQKFDPDAVYIEKYIPELKGLPKKYMFCPWESGIKTDYPDPIVNLKSSREQALTAFSSLKKES